MATKFAGNGLSRTAMVFKIATLAGHKLTVPELNRTPVSATATWSVSSSKHRMATVVSIPLTKTPRFTSAESMQRAILL